MADTALFASAFITKCKAGSGANSTAIASELLLNTLAQQAESYINVRSMKNWSDVYSTLNIDVKFLLQEVASNIQAMYVIQYDMSGYTSRSEAQTMLNVLRDRVEAGIELLKEIAKRDFIVGA